MKLMAYFTVIVWLAGGAVSAFETPPPTETEFLNGAVVVSSYDGNDEGRRNTGVRLTSLGHFVQDDVRVASVWRVRNSREYEQTVHLLGYRHDFSVDLVLPPDSEIVIASSGVDVTHVLKWLDGGTIDRKASNSDAVYTLPMAPIGGDDGKPADPPTDPPAADTRFEVGMAAWRAPDEIFEGAACANCHSPDAFDLAYFDFSREDIIRRAAPHLPDIKDQIAIADLVEFIREKYEITKPKNPRTFRPFQPGNGEVLPGANRFERDEAFGAQFRDAGYRFATVPILSMQEAQTQRDEWLNLDVRDVNFGIAFPLWSRDRFHGAEDISHNEWLPSLPRLPIAERLDEWYALQDAYIEDPSEENFYAYYDRIDKDYFLLEGQRASSKDRLVFTEQTTANIAKSGANQRFKAVQLATHLFRQEHIDGGRDRRARHYVAQDRAIAHNNIRKPGGLINPMWSVGDHYRVHDAEAFDFPEFAPYPPGLNDTFVRRHDHAQEIKTAWFLLGWTFDPGLVKTCCGNPGRTAEYFMHALSTSKELGPLQATYEKIGYPLHAQFIFTKTVISKNYDPYAVVCRRWGCPKDVTFNTGTSNFLGYNKHVKNTPKTNPAQREMYLAYTLNSMRLLLYMMEEKLDAGKPVHSKMEGRISPIKAFIEHAAATDENPNIEHDRALLSRVRAKLTAYLAG